jgi:curved DNA-binding protein CbpA
VDAPLPIVEAVYRALSLIHHPDRGGVHERMVEINLAYEKAKKFAKKE